MPTTPPTPAPTPLPDLSFSGSGDNVIQLPSAYHSTPAVVTATYHGSSNFIVSTLDNQNNENGGLVNVIGAYIGRTALNFNTNADTASLKVQASGPWTLKVDDPSVVRSFDSSVSGHGDDVVMYTGGAATVKMASSGQANFIVDEYPANGGSIHGLVNEIGAYSGVQPLQAGPAYIVIQDDGGWSINPQ